MRSVDYLNILEINRSSKVPRMTNTRESTQKASPRVFVTRIVGSSSLYVTARPLWSKKYAKLAIMAIIDSYSSVFIQLVQIHFRH